MATLFNRLRRFYQAPFAADFAIGQATTPEILETRRQTAIARLIISHLAAFQDVGLLLALFNRTPPQILIAQFASVVYVTICLILVFTPRVRLGILLYLYGIFVLVASIGAVNPGGLNLLAVLVNVLLALFILLNGLLLPRWSIWLSTALSLTATYINLAIAPLDVALLGGQQNPKALIAGFFSVIFVSVALLTYLLASSAAAGARSVLRAYRQELELAVLKDQFIIYINHELRTPLMGLYGNVELVSKLGDRIDSQARDGMLRRALQAGDSVMSMLSATLDVDILRPDAVRIHPEIIEIAPLVRGVIERFDPREIGEPGLESIAIATRDVSLIIPAGLMAYADPMRVEQVVVNLLSNALKYSPSGSPITIQASQHIVDSQPHTATIQISVTDTGLGVPPSEVAKLFQRFVRLERDIAGSVRGTGVGLYLCRIIVEAMGGRIWVQSTGIPGEGSTFIFTLPATATL